MPVTTTDKLSGKKDTVFVSRATSYFTQFNRRVAANLYLFCDIGPNLTARFVFTERVGVASPVVMRVRFDDGPVYHDLEDFRDESGNSLDLQSGHPEDDEGGKDTNLRTLLLTSSRVRVEFTHLPWAKDALLEFKTDGASDVARKLDCGSRK